MGIPTPPADASGGFIVAKYTNGSVTHRIRLHVAPFTADSAGTYSPVISGGEVGVAATFTAFATKLAPLLAPAFSISLDAVYRNVSGTITEIFTVTAPSAVVGTSASGAGLTEEYVACNMRSTGGGRFRFFIFSYAGWTYAAADTIVPNAGGTTWPQLIAYLDAATTGVRAHDGNTLSGNAHRTFGTNKKLRRRAGNA